VKRFLRRVAPAARPATLRLEVAPGDEGHVDFGFAGEVLEREQAARIGARPRSAPPVPRSSRGRQVPLGVQLDRPR
jgi:hypothetical protein